MAGPPSTPTPTTATPPRPEPGVMVISGVNWEGLRTLYLKEVRRFFKVQLQTIWAPAVTTLMFLAIFTVALSGVKPVVLGVAFADFLGPGLIVMAMIQNAFANASSSVLIAKVQGTIVDVLTPPLSAGELVLSYVAGGVTRAWFVGGAVWLGMALWPGVHVAVANPLPPLFFGTVGAVIVSLGGVLTGLWAEKFDHASAISNFVIQPLTLLSGTFYAIDRLAPEVQRISLANPFFYMIDGFRSGFIGMAEASPWVGAGYLLALAALLWGAAYRAIRRGWRIKA